MTNEEKRERELSAMVNKAVETLYSASISGTGLDKDTAERMRFELETGYLVQDLVTKRKISHKKEHLRGYKISLTSPETQGWFGANEPAYGTLTDSNMSDGVITLSDMSEPLIETELMFFIEEDIHHPVADEDLPGMISVAAGLEIPDSRFLDWFPKLSLGTIAADNAVAGKVVAGIKRKRLSYEELGNIDLKLYLNDKKIAEGHSSEVLGNPLEAVKWLIRKLDGKGKFLSRGMVISSGTFVLPMPLQRGTYRASYSTLGDVSLKVN